MTNEEAIQFLQAVKGCLLASNSWTESTHEPIKEAFGIAIEALEQQKEYKLDEWCTDCKEYDQEKHCCPRFNRVIRRTVEEMKGGEE